MVYKIGIIGTGRIAWQFDESMRVHPSSIAGAFSRLPNTKLITAASRGTDRLEAFGKKYGVRALYNDYQKMLKEQDLDIVVVTTHPPLHPEQVVTAAEAGVRGIFCEKPMALSLRECDLMLDACEKNRVKMLVNCTRRWDARYEAARRIVESKALGDLIHISAKWSGCKPLPEWEAKTEGPMLHDAVHLFDLMRFFAGEIEWVTGTARKRKRINFPVEDCTTAIFQFKGGADAVVAVDELTEYAEADIELQFEKGMIRLGVEDGMWKSRMSDFEQPWWYELEKTQFPPLPWTDAPLLVACRDMLECLETPSRRPKCDGHDGRAAIEIIMGVYDSARLDNKKVNFPVQNKERLVEVLGHEGKL